MLGQTPGTGGYLFVKCHGKRHAVHRLVLMAWCGEPSSSAPICRHLDGDPTNNRLANLAWGTPKQNARDAFQHKRIARLYLRGYAISTIAKKMRVKPRIVRVVVARRCQNIRQPVPGHWDWRAYPK